MFYKLDTNLSDCEVKFSGKKGEFTGYASVFNGVDAVMDTILPGAFQKSIKSNRPKMFVNHNSFEVPVGDWVNLSEDSKGLIATGKIDLNHKDGPSVFSALERKAMDALSIGFRIPKGGAIEKDNGIREISEIDLKEISIVNFPADDAARIDVVKFEMQDIKSLSDAENFLRESGRFSKSAACAFVSRVKSMLQGEPVSVDKNEIMNLEKRLATKMAVNEFKSFLNKL